MLLHIGQNRSVPLERILFVLNGRGAAQSAKDYISRAKKERRFMACAGKPKCYVVVKERGRETVYASMIASATLEKRWRNELERRYVKEAAVLTITAADN